jgi:hypothetical protein
VRRRVCRGRGACRLPSVRSFAAIGLLGFGLLSACGHTAEVPRSAGVGGTAQPDGGGGGMTSTGQGGAWPGDFCTACSARGPLASLTDPAILEASGLVASLAAPGVFYVHNDSGDAARFFAIGGDGVTLGTFALQGATAVDIEDIARGPCAQGTCLFLGDIGDNGLSRPSIQVYRAVEPSPAGQDATLATDVLELVYPDGAHNAEALLADPTSGALLIVTKVSAGPSQIFTTTGTLAPGRPHTLTLVGELTPLGGSPRVTGGDVHPTRKGILLRTYTDVLYYAVGSGQPLGEALGATPCILPQADEAQGEAIAWTADGLAYLTVSEGLMPSLEAFDCAAP